MQVTTSIDNKHRAVVLEFEDIDPANFKDVVLGVLSCAIRLGADSPISVKEDSQMNLSDAEPKSETESKN